MTSIQHAHWWVKTYCPHMACPGSDQQTLERMTTDQQQTAREMLQLLDDAGLVLWDGYQPKGNRPRNFILLNLEAPMESQNEWLSAENRRLSAQVEQLMRDLHAMDGQRERAQQLANSMAEQVDAAMKEAREQEPVAFWWIGPDGKGHGGPYSGAPCDEAVNNARNSGCEAHFLYAAPVPAPAVPADWRNAVEIGAKWMRHWLSDHDCECETVHTCGYTQRSAELRRMEALLQSA